MAVNNKQKIIVLDISANTQELIEDKLQQGYVIEFMLSLTPVFNKFLIVYATPESI